MQNNMYMWNINAMSSKLKKLSQDMINNKDIEIDPEVRAINLNSIVEVHEPLKFWIMVKIHI